jgi:hypothetical protein
LTLWSEIYPCWRRVAGRWRNVARDALLVPGVWTIRYHVLAGRLGWSDECEPGTYRPEVVASRGETGDGWHAMPVGRGLMKEPRCVSVQGG